MAQLWPKFNKSTGMLACGRHQQFRLQTRLYEASLETCYIVLFLFKHTYVYGNSPHHPLSGHNSSMPSGYNGARFWCMLMAWPDVLHKALKLLASNEHAKQSTDRNSCSWSPSGQRVLGPLLCSVINYILEADKTSHQVLQFPVFKWQVKYHIWPTWTQKNKANSDNSGNLSLIYAITTCFIRYSELVLWLYLELISVIYM